MPIAMQWTTTTTISLETIILTDFYIVTMSAGIRAFSRSRVLLGPGRSDVDIAMTKWWTKKRPAEGQVRPSALQLLQLLLLKL